MAEPFVFHFRRSETGQPEQMYLADVRAACGLCKHPQLQRFYHSTPVHPITVRRLEELASSVREKTGYECPNCGEEVSADHAVSTAFTWAFPDDSGLIRGFLRDATEPASLTWQFVERRRLDPQELPGWEPVEGDPAYDALTPDLVEDALGRVVSPKETIRRVLADWFDDPDGGAVRRLSRDMWLVAEGPNTTVDDLRPGAADGFVAVSLDDCVPHGLPTYEDASELPGQLGGWLPDEIDRTAVWLLVDEASVIETTERPFGVANLTWERTETGFEEITTPRELVYPRPLPTMAVLRRAVYTGLTPGDAARLTAEEIVGTLLTVW